MHAGGAQLKDYPAGDFLTRNFKDEKCVRSCVVAGPETLEHAER
jgi:hypothetical protein